MRGELHLKTLIVTITVLPLARILNFFVKQQKNKGFNAPNRLTFRNYGIDGP